MMLGTKTKSVDWIAEAKQAHAQATELRASVRPQREAWAAVQRELDQLQAALLAATETINDYKYNERTQVTEAGYRDAVATAKELRGQIDELAPIVDRRKAEADTLGRKMSYRAEGVGRELVDRLRQAQQDELKAVLDVLNGRS